MELRENCSILNEHQQNCMVNNLYTIKHLDNASFNKSFFLSIFLLNFFI